MSASEILDEMLGNMPESYQKTIGFPTYDLLAAVSLRMEGTDEAIDEAKQQLDPENLHDSALDRYIYPRSGLERKAATFAHGSLTVTGTGTVEQGTLFESGGGVQYYATETVAIEGEGTVPVTCTVDGTAGNLPAHSVTQMPVAVQGIASCDNPEPIGGGYAEESDSEYFSRYLVVLRTPATSGNVYHYIQWALEVAGVGHVKVFPRVQGANTVDVVIADNAGEIQIAECAAVYAARLVLLLLDDLARADLGCAGQRVVARWRAGEITAAEAMRQTGLKANTFYRRCSQTSLALKRIQSI